MAVEVQEPLTAEQMELLQVEYGQNPRPKAKEQDRVCQQVGCTLEQLNATYRRWRGMAHKQRQQTAKEAEEGPTEGGPMEGGNFSAR